MKKRIAYLIFLTIFLFSVHGTALAQDYLFNVVSETVHAYWNEDGTLSLDYTFVFENSPSGHAIEFVDLGMPNSNFNESNISAEVNGNPVDYISRSEYQGSGVGVAVALGEHSIPPGQSGEVHIFVGIVEDVLYTDSTDENYASAVFSPAYFESRVVFGATNLTVVYHLPPGVQPDEPRWHESPNGFPSTPTSGHDDHGRIIYSWNNPNATADRRYEFGASFPNSYVPSSAIVSPSLLDRLGIDPDAVIGFLCMGSIFGIFILFAVLGAIASRRRKMKYLPPKIRIEGHGIKRGLTAVEAAVLMEQPMDKILTMILFAVVKKDAAQVVDRDPLKLNVKKPIPQNLHKYERKFLEAFEESRKRDQQKKLQNMMILLIKSVSQKMKGFSHKETVGYYKDIMRKAWSQVEAADTPEVKSQKFDEYMGWTMLDRDFEDRTQDVFRTGPVFLPTWWGRYDPGWRPSSRPTPTASRGGRPTPSLPNLPGGEFAASVVTGIQNFSSDVVGDVANFTNRITQKTNPIPKSSSRSSSWSGGSSSCACACACAGCACACAGGGR